MKKAASDFVKILLLANLAGVPLSILAADMAFRTAPEVTPQATTMQGKTETICVNCGPTYNGTNNSGFDWYVTAYGGSYPEPTIPEGNPYHLEAWVAGVYVGQVASNDMNGAKRGTLTIVVPAGKNYTINSRAWPVGWGLFNVTKTY